MNPRFERGNPDTRSMGDFIHRVNERSNVNDDDLARFSTFFRKGKEKKGKKKRKKEGRKQEIQIIILIYTRFDMDILRGRSEESRMSKFERSKEYIAIFPCEHILKSIRRRSANFRKLDDT